MVANFTWQTLIGGVRSREWLCEQFQPHLKEYAGDFADWVLDFMGQAVKHFQSLDSLFVTSASNPSTAEVCQRENVVVTSDHGNRSVTAISIDQGTASTAMTEDYSATASGPFSQPLARNASFGNPNGTGSTGSNRSTNTVVFGSGMSSGSFWPQQGGQSTGGFGGSSCYDNPIPLNSQQPVSVDPLDDTLDNLIRKQKMYKMQGRSDIAFGVRMRSTKFGSSDAPDSAVSPFTLETSALASQNQVATVQMNSGSHSPFGSAPPSQSFSTNDAKIPKMCIKYPNCEFGESCRYIHPTPDMCKHWPKCAFGPKCAYVHPPIPCRFNTACTNPACNYEHRD